MKTFLDVTLRNDRKRTAVTDYAAENYGYKVTWSVVTVSRRDVLQYYKRVVY